ncbi:MAG: 4Fe-4S dicluster domain-containing protein [Phycisphaerae bacterium]|nr:4Fe-4S dicluster domain-containing protein [Phycisphaerae bacterium]
MTTNRWRRQILRCAFLAAAVLLAAPLLPYATSPYVSAASPFVAISAAVAARTVSVMTLVALPFLFAALLWRRWFCRYTCPLGLILEQPGRLRSPRPSRLAKWPRIGLWILLITLAGSALGYPLLLWTDPLAIVTSIVGLPWQPSRAATIIVGIVAAAILILSAAVPGAWCARICPLGAMQDLLATLRRRIRRNRNQPTPADPESGLAVPRRSILALPIGAAWAALALRQPNANTNNPLRPPGALPDPRFAGLCIRCGNCIRACPERILTPDLDGRRIASLLTPTVSFTAGYCAKPCVACAEVCPSGAIPPLSPDNKVRATIGLPVIDHEQCILNATECRRCIAACPYEALSTRWDEETYQAVLAIDMAKCPGCGACQLVCPTSPKSIVIQPPPSRSGTIPLQPPYGGEGV